MRSARSTIRLARLACSALFLANGAVVGCWVPFIPERALALHLSPGRLGATLLGGGVGAVLAMPLAGALVPRVGSRGVAMAGGAGFAVVLFFATQAPSARSLLLTLVLFGLCGAGMDVAMNAQAVAVEKRSGQLILSSLHGLYSLGNVVGAFAMSAAFARGWPHRWLSLTAAVVLALAVLCSGPAMMADRHVKGPADRTQRSFAPQLLWLGALVVAAMIAEGAMADWSGVYLRNARHLGAGWAGVGFGLFATLMLCGRLLGDRITGRFGERRVLWVGAGLAVGASLLIAWTPHIWLTFVGFACLGAGLANASPLLYRAASRVPGVAASVGLATSVGMGYAGLLAGPPLLGGVAQAFGLRSIFLVIAGLCALLCAAAWFRRGAEAVS